MNFETFLKGLDFLIPLERVPAAKEDDDTVALAAEPFFTGVSSFCCVVAPGSGPKRLGFRPTRQKTVRKLRRGRSRTKVEKDEDGTERTKALELTQRITLYKGFYRQLPVILIKWSILGSRVVYVLDHSMASQMESASVSSLPVRNSSSKKSEDLLKNKEQAKTLSRTQVYVSFVHMTLCWGKEVHVPVENGNAAVTESLKAMQDWIKGAKLATNGTARNVIDKEMFSPVSYFNHSNAMGANAKLALEDVQAIVEQQDKAWLSFMDNVYILGEHVSVNNDISHIPNWDAVAEAYQEIQRGKLCTVPIQEALDEERKRIKTAMDDVIGEQSGQKKDAEMEMDVVGEEDAISRIVGQVQFMSSLDILAHSLF